MKPWRSTFFSNGLIFGSALAGGVLAARFLGVEDRGLLAAIIYWPHFIAGIAAMGLNEGIVIRTAKSGSTDTLVATAFALSIALALPVGFIGYFLMPFLLGESRQDYLQFSQIYFLVFLPVTFLAQNLLAIDQGESRFRRFNVQRIVQALAYPLLLLVLWFANILTVEHAAIAVLAGTAIVALNRVWYARSGLTVRPSLLLGWQLLVQSVRLHVVNVVTALAMEVDKMVLILFSSNTQLGLYTIGITAASALPSLFVQTYINIMMPTAAKLGSKQEGIQEILVPLRKLTGIIIVSSILLLLLMPYLIPLVFGDDFDAAGSYAQVLVLAFSFVSIKRVVVYLLRAWQLNYPAILGEGFTVLILTVGAFFAVQWWDTMGLCVLVLFAHAGGAALMCYFFFKETGVTLRQFMRLDPILAR